MSRSRAASLAVMQARNGIGAKTDNRPHALAAKIEIRSNVLAAMGDAEVFEAFCGRGEMYRAVWSKARGYAGCDIVPWRHTDPPRFVADNRRLMRCLDLSRFNVFDFDAYGSPWEQMEILAHRRTWARGERVGMALTDGGLMKLRFGGNTPGAIARISGVTKALSSERAAKDITNATLRAWLDMTRLRVTKLWKAESATAAQGTRTSMLYLGFVAEGV